MICGRSEFGGRSEEGFVCVADIGGVLGSFVSTGLLPALAVGVVASAVLTRVAVRLGWVRAPGWLIYAAMLSVAGVLVFTVFREGVLLAAAVVSGEPLLPPGWQGLRQWSPHGWQRAVADPLGNTQVLANIALFVPAGAVWTVITRRPWRVLAALCALSVGIEVLQGVTGLGANDGADIVANVAGALAGVAAGVALGWGVDGLRGHRVGARRWAVRGVAVATVCAGALVLPGIGAARQQAAVADKAAARFQGTTVTDVARWEREDQLMDRVWRAVTVDVADGWSRSSASASARYPVSFLGHRRCVLVVWHASDVAVQRHSGTICQRVSL